MVLSKKIINFAPDLTTHGMKNLKIYEPEDKMINVISDNYSVLQILSAFGISMGFGDKTIREVCSRQGVDCFTFMVIVNYMSNGHLDPEAIEKLSLSTLLRYLRASHTYYLDYELPTIRRALTDAIDERNNLATLILRLYDNFQHSIRGHMLYEEKTLFPFVESLIVRDRDLISPATSELHTSDATYAKHHDQTDLKLKELKNIIIKYLPADEQANNQLLAALYQIYNTERWLHQHVDVEENIFLPAIRAREAEVRQTTVQQRISSMISVDNQEVLSEREKDVIVCLVQGMSNKEIADHLFIALNTVMTHRRNIAKKLQIHTAAGLTVYAIVNNLIDISSVKL